MNIKKVEKKIEASHWGEIIKFLISGGVCFLVQFVLLVALRDGVGMNTSVALLLAFLVAMGVNYLFCVLWIWPSARDNNAAAKIGFVITSLLGLLLNEGFMWLFRVTLGEDQVLFSVLGKDVSMYMINACVTTVLVMFWNFFTKRAILQSRLLQKWAGRAK